MKRLTALALVALVAVPVGIAVRTLWLQNDSDPHGELSKLLDELQLPEALDLVAEQRFGTAGCLQGACPRVDRYYASSANVDTICEELETALERWADSLERLASGCEFAGQVNGNALVVSVRADIEVEPEFDQVDPPHIDVPHEAVAVIGLTAED